MLSVVTHDASTWKAQERQRQEDGELKASLGYIRCLISTWAIRDPVLKKKLEINQGSFILTQEPSYILLYRVKNYTYSVKI